MEPVGIQTPHVTLLLWGKICTGVFFSFVVFFLFFSQLKARFYFNKHVCLYVMVALSVHSLVGLLGTVGTLEAERHCPSSSPSIAAEPPSRKYKHIIDESAVFITASANTSSIKGPKFGKNCLKTKEKH